MNNETRKKVLEGDELACIENARKSIQSFLNKIVAYAGRPILIENMAFDQRLRHFNLFICL